MQNLRLMLIAIVVDLDSNGRNNAHRTVKVLVNDLDPNGDKLRLASVTQPQNGAVAIIGDTGVYTPKQGFTGIDTFTYTVSDDPGGYDTAMVVVGVVGPAPPPNQSPIARNDTAENAKSGC
ncbi:MAG: Ig-like domain-containing protein [Planctomycetes bacterium]|nr:Ig-like domain-containing protein [Planctomycetota bacterium]